MLTLVLVRHGETALNAARRYQGRSDPPLSPRGILQARDLRSVLAGSLGLGSSAIPTACVYTSDTERAWSTAALALPDLCAALEPRLRELDFGAFDGLTYEENLARHGDSFRAWIADPDHVRPPGGETLDELDARIADWLAGLPESGCVIAFTHGGPIHAIIARLLHLPFVEARRWEVAPADALRFLLPPRSQGPLMPPERLQDLDEGGARNRAAARLRGLTTHSGIEL